MPLYDYDCAACGRRFEVVHGVHADGPTACPLCGSGPVRKAITAAAVHFKGSGWAKKERRAAVTSGAAASADGDGRGRGRTRMAVAGPPKTTEGGSSSDTKATPAAAGSTTEAGSTRSADGARASGTAKGSGKGSRASSDSTTHGD